MTVCHDLRTCSRVFSGVGAQAPDAIWPHHGQAVDSPHDCYYMRP